MPPISLADWAFGQRLRQAGLLGSMGSIGDCFDISMVESFFGTLQLEQLDRRSWPTRQALANAIFEYIACVGGAVSENAPRLCAAPADLLKR